MRTTSSQLKIETREQLECLSFSQIFEYIQALQQKIATLESHVKRKDMRIINLKEEILREKDSGKTEEIQKSEDVALEDELSSFLEEEENKKYVIPQLGRRSHSFSDLVGPTIADMIKGEESNKNQLQSSTDSTGKPQKRINKRVHKESNSNP